MWVIKKENSPPAPFPKKEAYFAKLWKNIANRCNKNLWCEVSSLDFSRCLYKCPKGPELVLIAYQDTKMEDSRYESLLNTEKMS